MKKWEWQVDMWDRQVDKTYEKMLKERGICPKKEVTITI